MDTGFKLAQDLPRWDSQHISRNTSPDTYGDGLSELAMWTHWATFTWRPRSVMMQTTNGAHLIRRFDQHETSPRTTSRKQVDPISMPAVRRAVGRYCLKLKPAAIWWATEEGGRFGRHHVHALMRLTPNQLRYKNPWSQAFRWFGRSEVEEYDPEKGASHYVSKYVTKELADFDFWTRRSGYRS